MHDDLLTTKDVGDMFRVSPHTVAAWARTGQIRHLQTPTGHYRFWRADVETLWADLTGSEATSDRRPA